MVTEDIYNSDEGIFSEKEEKLLRNFTPKKEYTVEETRSLITDVDEKAAEKKTFRLIRYLTALKNYLLDRDVEWYKKSLVIGALIYFVTPIDAIPDFMPVAGYLDDLGVITWVIKFLGDELKNRI